jgi:Mg2+/Co2+ transporter CorB
MEQTAFTLAHWLSLGGVFACMVFSAFFSACETALMSASKPKLHALKEDGNATAKKVLTVVNQPDELLGTILLGNNLVNIGGSAITTSLFIDLFGAIGVAYATLVMTITLLIFSEVLPKTIASRMPERISLAIITPMLWLVYFSRPITRVVRFITTLSLRLLGFGNEQGRFSEHDVRGALSLGLQHGVLEAREHRMLDSILDLTELTVADIMVHRAGMLTVNADMDVDEMFNHLSALSVSRIPVWKNTPDNIIGTIHVRDFYPAKANARITGEPFNLNTVLRPPYFVPETISVDRQLLEFRKKRQHMALVVDEYGDIKGLLTLEDILEEIVGEIEDEFDSPKGQLINREATGAVVVNGSVSVRDINRELHWNLPEEDAVTLAGLLIATAGHIPTQGENVRVNGYKFQILSKHRHHIGRVRAFAPHEGIKE